ncbi:hypothetical protein ACIBCA_22915 [Kitasatospora sp. NPDC051170]|uniref:hypothetical protein n=1 Tax=Kitasatospora sp. NPDC051170 TaxID=3364056 RepID=UPI0037B20043
MPRGNDVTSPSAPRVDSEPDGVGLTVRGGDFYDIQGNHHRNNIIHHITDHYG